MTDEERRRVPYWFLTKLMLNRATLENADILPIANLHDNMEQWGVYEHLRTYMTTSVSSNLNTLVYTKDGIKSLIDGPLYCLCDSLNSCDWDFIRSVWNSAYTENVYGNAGVTLVWSDKALDRELEEFFFEIIVPMEEQIEIKDGKRKANLKKVFPGYVLIKMIVTEESWYIVRNTRGVTGFVGSGTDPIPLTDEEIRNMGFEKVEVNVDYNVNHDGL